eukprot:TRINITY_DN42876_c0_g1_i1.p1 TRINITY_DN42876_c0_g1~~TRINITY_DN42876_c0_g1_i1.p1  ORF type:complete len:445 (+),score=137.75 TRINITY_DN42876_c0_g1_i1:56-1336(+)
MEGAGSTARDAVAAHARMMQRRRAIEHVVASLASTRREDVGAFTMLADDYGSGDSKDAEQRRRDVTAAVSSRLRRAADKDKLAHWCLLDSVLKSCPDYRSDLLEEMHKLLSKHIPWQHSPHIPTYELIMRSWETSLGRDAAERLWAEARRSLQEAPAPPRKRSLLQEWNEAVQADAAADAQSARDMDPLLVPVPCKPASDAAAPAAAVEAAAETRELAVAESADGDDMLTSRELGKMLSSMYFATKKQCPRTGVRYRSSFDMENHMDRLFKRRTTAPKWQKVRCWYHRRADWSGIRDTRAGDLAVILRSEVGEYGAVPPGAGSSSAAAAATPAAASATDLEGKLRRQRERAEREQSGDCPAAGPKASARCAVCTETFKTVFDGAQNRWVYGDSVFAMVAPAPGHPLRRLPVHSDCAPSEPPAKRAR